MNRSDREQIISTIFFNHIRNIFVSFRRIFQYQFNEVETHESHSKLFKIDYETNYQHELNEERKKN